jgi:tetratricopeptide (TPR) repeat protein
MGPCIDQAEAGRPRRDASVPIVEVKRQVVEHIANPTSGTPEFLQRVLDELQSLPEDVHLADRADTIGHIARWLYINARFDAALDAGRIAVRYATKASNAMGEFRGRLACACSLREVGAYVEALSELSAAIELSQSMRRADLQAMATNNLGNLYVDLGIFEDALSLFERIAAYFETSGDDFSMQMALDNAAIAALRLGRVEAGLRLAQRAAEVWVGPVETAQDRLWSVQGSLPLCQLLIRSGRYDEALACARLAKVVAVKSGLTRALTSAEIAMAVSQYCYGPQDAGLVDRMLAVVKADDPVLYDYALEAAVRAFEQVGHFDRALVLQQELVRFCRKHRVEQTRKVLGGPSPEEIDEHSRLVSLRRDVEQTLCHLERIAVDQSLRGGYDHFRVYRLGRLAGSFAEFAGWPDLDRGSMTLAAKLIDVGMMVIPDDLLSRQRELFAAEREIVNGHADFSAEILLSARLAVLQACVPIVRYHHERWDGRGPCGLKGEEIPAGARLVSLCDAFDALCHRRPWRAALPIEQALLIIREGAGTQFDPELAVRFIDWVRRLRSQVPDLDAYLGTEALDNDYVRMRDRIERLVHGPA